MTGQVNAPAGRRDRRPGGRGRRGDCGCGAHLVLDLLFRCEAAQRKRHTRVPRQAVLHRECGRMCGIARGAPQTADEAGKERAGGGRALTSC